MSDNQIKIEPLQEQDVIQTIKAENMKEIEQKGWLLDMEELLSKMAKYQKLNEIKIMQSKGFFIIQMGLKGWVNFVWGSEKVRLIL